MRVVAGGAGNFSPGHQRQDNLVLILKILDLGFDLFRRGDEKMRSYMRIAHFLVASKTEEGHFRLELDAISAVKVVNILGMTERADQFAVYKSQSAIFIVHFMDINLGVFLLVMALETKLTNVAVGASPQ